MSFLSKLKKSISNDVRSGGSLLKKKTGQGFDSIQDVLYSDSKWNQPSETIVPALSKLWEGLNYTGDLGSGMVTTRFAEPTYDENGDLQAKFSLNAAKKNLQSPSRLLFGGNTPEWKTALQKEGRNNGPTGGLSSLGQQEYWDSNLPQGAKVGLNLASDPSMYIPAGSIGKLSTKLGLEGSRAAKLLLGSEKAGASSRSARIGGGLLEGVGKSAPLFAAGSGALAEAADRLPEGPWKGVAGMAAPLLGGSASQIGANAIKKGIISDKSGDVFRDLTKHLETAPLPEKAPATKWTEILNKMQVTKKEQEENGIADLIREKGNNAVITRQEIMDRVKEYDFDIEEKIYNPNSPYGSNWINDGVYYENPEARPGDNPGSGTRYGDTSEYTVPGDDPGTHREIFIKQKPKTHTPKPEDFKQVRDDGIFHYTSPNGVQYTMKRDNGGWWVLTRFGNGGAGSGAHDIRIGNEFKGKTPQEAIDLAAKTDPEINPRVNNNQLRNNEVPDVLAHIRVGDREGGRQLFVHEIQSDWAQENRSGIRTHTSVPGVEDKSEDQWFSEFMKSDDPEAVEAKRLMDRGNLTWNMIDQLRYADGPFSKAFKEYISKNEVKFPSHPFQENWQALAVKRVLRYAADNGYDSVRFATGEESLKIPGMEEFDPKKRQGRLNSYNRSIPDTVNGLAKRFGYKVEKIPPENKTGTWSGGESIDADQLYDIANNTYDVAMAQSIMETALFMRDHKADIPDVATAINYLSSSFYPQADRDSMARVAEYLGLEKNIDSDSTVVRLDAASRGAINSKPQTMFGVTDGSSGNIDFEEQMRFWRQKSMSSDPQEAAQAEAQLQKLGEMRSQGMASDSVKVPRGAKLDELSNQEFEQQVEMIQKHKSETYSSGYTGNESAWEQVGATGNVVNAEALRRNLVHFERTKHGFDMVLNSTGKQLIGWDDEVIKDLFGSIENFKKYFDDWSPNGSASFANRDVVKIEEFMRKLGEGWGEYLDRLKARKEAEGGRGFFGQMSLLGKKAGGFLDEAERVMGGVRHGNKLGVVGDNSDPNAAKRAERQRRLQAMRDETMTPPQNEIDPQQLAGERIDQDAAWAQRAQGAQSGVEVAPQAQGFQAEPKTPDQFSLGARSAGSNELTQLGQPTGPSFGQPPVPPPPAPPMRTAGSEPYRGSPALPTPPPVATADSKPVTMRDHLNQIIWRDKSLQEGEDPFGLPTGSESVRAKDLANTRRSPFQRPTAPKNIGDIRLRAQELLDNLTDEELNQVIGPETDFAELFHSMVNSKYINDLIEKRKSLGTKYLTGGQPPKEPEVGGAMSGGLPVANTKTIDINEATTPQETEAVADTIDNVMQVGGATYTRGGTATPPGGPTIRVITPEEEKPVLNYLGDVRDINEVEAEVKTHGTKNVIANFLAGKLGINPSALLRSPVGRLTTALWRQNIAIEQLTAVAAAPLDSMSGIFRNNPLKLDRKGIMKNLGVHWNDVLAEPSKYFDKMTPEQQEYANVFQQILDDVSNLREIHGLEKLPRDTGGRLYIPRIVKGVEGVEVLKPTNHRLLRMWELATEAVQKGEVDYADPRETVKMYVYDTYREIVKQQYADAMENITKNLDDMTNPRIRNNYFGKQYDRQFALMGLKEAKAQLAANPDSEDLKVIVANQRALVEAANKEYAKALTSFEGDKARLRAQENNKTLAYDESGKRIPVRTFNVARLGQRVVSPEDYDILTNYVGILGTPPKQREGPLSLAAGAAGRTFRFATSSFDFAAPFTHNLPMMFNNPGRWAKATVMQYMGYANPRVKANYILDNLETINNMAKHGIPIGDSDYFELAQKGSGINKLYNRKLKDVPVLGGLTGQLGKQTAGRFASAMETSLLVARTELWKANEAAFMKKGNLKGLAQYVQNMSGALDARSLMVSKGQRDWESLWLAFSPRLFRSTVSLMAMAAKPTTQEGRAALRSLAIMAAGTAGTLYLVNRLAGNSHEDAMASINPTEEAGRKFGAIKIDGSYYGLGGQLRAAAQMLGKSGKALAVGDFNSFKTWDQNDNPILAYYSGRGAPGTHFTQNIVEGLTGANANPYDEIDGIGFNGILSKDGGRGLLAQTARDFLPFTAQNIIEGQNSKQVFAGANGLRVTAFTRSEETQMRVESLGWKTLDGLPITDVEGMNKEQKKKFYETYPIEQSNPNDNITKMFNLFEDEDSAYVKDIYAASANVNRGLMTKEEFKNYYNERTREKFDKVEGIKSTFATMPADRYNFTGSVIDYLNSRDIHPEDKAVSDYYDISSNTPLKPDGSIDFDGISAKKLALLNSLPDNQRAYVERQTSKASQVSQNKLVTEYDIVKDITKEYFDSDEKVFDYFKTASPFMSNFNNYEAYQKWMEKSATEMGLTGATLEGFLAKKFADIKVFNSIKSDYKKALRLTNPQLDRALVDWYGQEPANRIDYLLSGYGSDAGAALGPAIFADSGINSSQNAIKASLALRDSGFKNLQKRTFTRPVLSQKDNMIQ